MSIMAECEFLGLIIPPGESVKVQAKFDEDIVETLHFTQAALGAKAKPGPHVVFVEKGGQKFAVGTLEGGRCPQFSCDITFAMDEVSLSHSGSGEVHLTGYRVEQMVGGGSDDEEYGHAMGSSDEEEESEEGSEEEDEESSDEEAPDAVPLQRGGKPIKPRARQLIDDEAEEASSEEEEEEEEMEDDSEEEAKANGHVVRIVGDDDSEEEEESSGEEEDKEEEEESGSEDDDDDEDYPAAAPPAKKQQRQQGAQVAAAAAAGAKRPLADQARTPQPAKKARGEQQQQKAPATAPAKVAGAKDGAKEGKEARAPPAGMATPGTDKEYLEALKAALKAGPLKLATLGTKVKRPPNAPKQKHFIDRHPGVFKYDKANDVVTLVQKD